MTAASNSVRVGQLWADNDQRYRALNRRQHIRVVALVDYVPGRNAPGPYAKVSDEDTGMSNYIRTDRMKPTSTGYRLIEDVTPEDVEVWERLHGITFDEVRIIASSSGMDEQDVMRVLELAHGMRLTKEPR